MKMIPILLLQFRTGCFCAVTSKTWKTLAFKLLRKSTGQLHDNLKEMSSFVAQQCQLDEHVSAKKVSVDPSKLQGKQLEAFNVVKSHCSSQDQQPPLKMIMSGTAGTGKSYLIWCLQELLGDQLRVMAPTGAAAYNVHGHTLHFLLSIPVRGDFRDLEGQHLHTLQETLASVRYIILDEMSMVGRKLFGQVDRRLRQVIPHQ